MKTPEHLRTSHDLCCKVPSPQSPFAMSHDLTQCCMMSNPQAQWFSHESTDRCTDIDETDSITSTADTGGNEDMLAW